MNFITDFTLINHLEAIMEYKQYSNPIIIIINANYLFVKNS